MGKVIGLQPVAPSWVIPATDSKSKEILGNISVRNGRGNSIVVPVEDVISFKDIDLNDPYGRGRGTSEAIGDEIQSDEIRFKIRKKSFLQ